MKLARLILLLLYLALFIGSCDEEITCHDCEEQTIPLGGSLDTQNTAEDRENSSQTDEEEWKD